MLFAARSAPMPSVRGHLPTGAGIGLRAAHTGELLNRESATGWLEIHSENYFADGGAHIDALRTLRARYPISAHGVGLSLGSPEGPSVAHLTRLAALIEWLEPAFVSEHLAWGAIDGIHSNDLLPLPYTEEALARFVRAVDCTQEFLRRPILIENVSSYVEFTSSTMPEWTFLSTLARRSGCGILLDVNNIEVSAMNHGFDPFNYIDAIPPGLVKELHVAGHSAQSFAGQEIVVDTHDRAVAPSTWLLLRHALRRFGPLPVLVEWDVALPPLAVLETEAARAEACIAEIHARAA